MQQCIDWFYVYMCPSEQIHAPSYEIDSLPLALCTEGARPVKNENHLYKGAASFQSGTNHITVVNIRNMKEIVIP
jgi:hypothetical protein